MVRKLNVNFFQILTKEDENEDEDPEQDMENNYEFEEEVYNSNSKEAHIFIVQIITQYYSTKIKSYKKEKLNNYKIQNESDFDSKFDSWKFYNQLKVDDFEEPFQKYAKIYAKEFVKYFSVAGEQNFDIEIDQLDLTDKEFFFDNNLLLFSHFSFLLKNEILEIVNEIFEDDYQGNDRLKQIKWVGCLSSIIPYLSITEIKKLDKTFQKVLTLINNNLPSCTKIYSLKVIYYCLLINADFLQVVELETVSKIFIVSFGLLDKYASDLYDLEKENTFVVPLVSLLLKSAKRYNSFEQLVTDTQSSTSNLLVNLIQTPSSQVFPTQSKSLFHLFKMQILNLNIQLFQIRVDLQPNRALPLFRMNIKILYMFINRLHESGFQAEELIFLKRFLIITRIGLDLFISQNQQSGIVDIFAVILTKSLNKIKNYSASQIFVDLLNDLISEVANTQYGNEIICRYLEIAQNFYIRIENGNKEYLKLIFSIVMACLPYSNGSTLERLKILISRSVSLDSKNQQIGYLMYHELFQSLYKAISTTKFPIGESGELYQTLVHFKLARARHELENDAEYEQIPGYGKFTSSFFLLLNLPLQMEFTNKSHFIISFLTQALPIWDQQITLFASSILDNFSINVTQFFENCLKYLPNQKNLIYTLLKKSTLLSTISNSLNKDIAQKAQSLLKEINIF
ncbi:hypothetical protein M0812_20630 [Anaeramoeba flamelloides]|uniref:Uncharacterized protein n=1 Tax=Anaeramoeba flamelloides TaxID=1746091 RepID=A0AAV7YSQ6_9EUKA|nr:hypothetical protein M0812_20630 [Anaeramoeba flamelloides]